MNSRSDNEENLINNSIIYKEIGVNTDEIDPEELRRLVENNKELQDEHVKDVQDEVSEIKKVTNKNKKMISQTIKNLTEKEYLLLLFNLNRHIIEILKSSNLELKEKISSAELQYKEIFAKLNEKTKEEDLTYLNLKLKEIEKEIMATNASTDNYKKLIDSMKNKLEFKSNLERAINLETILKIETGKNKEIKKEFDSLCKVNDLQSKALNNYDKENRITEKIELLKSEIKSIKESIKDIQDKNTKQDKYIKNIHSRLTLFEMNLKKFSLPKSETKKNFTKEEFIQNLEILNNLKNEIKEKRKRLANLTKQNEDKLNSMITLNKKIEMDFKENDKLNKMLIYKKNELRKIIRQNEKKSENCENKKNEKIIIENELINARNKLEKNNTIEIISENIQQMMKYNKMIENSKIFSKNQNQKNLKPIDVNNIKDNYKDEEENEPDVDEEGENMINDSDVENNTYDKEDGEDSNLFEDEHEDDEEETDKYAKNDYNVIENFNVEIN